MKTARFFLAMIAIACLTASLALPVRGEWRDLMPVEAEGVAPVRDVSQPYLALHFTGTLEGDALARHIRQTLQEAPTLAGVRHLFVLTGEVEVPPGLESEERRALVRDTDGSTGQAFEITGAAVVVLDPQREVLTRTDSVGSGAVAFRSLSAQIEMRWRHPALRLYATERGVAVGGYDPVAMVTEERAIRGTRAHSSSWRGIMFHFASAENRNAFARDPERYQPAFGGWCATTMAEGERLEPDPRNFLVEEGRVLLFSSGIFGNARDAWQERAEDLRPQAFRHWERMTTSDARGR